jgi:hypothetical protein
VSSVLLHPLRGSVVMSTAAHQSLDTLTQSVRKRSRRRLAFYLRSNPMARVASS